MQVDDISKEAIEEIDFNFREIEYFIDKYKKIYSVSTLEQVGKYYLTDIQSSSIQVIKNLRAILYQLDKSAKNGN